MTAMPPALDQFGAQLETAIRRDLGSRRRRRRLLSAAILPAAIAAVAVGVLVGLPGGSSPAVGRAAAALQVSDNTILHMDMRAEQHNPDGSVVRWQSESWQLGEAPFTRRQIEIGSDGIRAESLTRGDVNELYDAKTDTIYIASQQELAAASPLPDIKIVSKARLRKLTHSARASAALTVAKDKKGYSVIATKEGAKRFREQQAKVQGADANGSPAEPFRAEALALLRSGRAQETGKVEVGGREAIRLASPDGKRVYLVDAETYAPIEWTTSGDGGSVTLRFPVYEQLPVDDDSMRLLDLEAQHPGAQVERGAAAYNAAEARLFPHG